MKTAKDKVENLVKEYMRIFPTEYNNFLKANAAKIDNLGTKYAELKGSDLLIRHLFDLPETLHFAIKRGLNENELEWLYSQGEYEGKRAGLMWFIRRFPQFKVTKDF